MFILVIYSEWKNFSFCTPVLTDHGNRAQKWAGQKKQPRPIGAKKCPPGPIASDAHEYALSHYHSFSTVLKLQTHCQIKSKVKYDSNNC